LKDTYFFFHFYFYFFIFCYFIVLYIYNFFFVLLLFLFLFFFLSNTIYHLFIIEISIIFFFYVYSLLFESNTKVTLSTFWRSIKNGINSNSSLSSISLNQLVTGIAFVGWKIYDAGELSNIITCFKFLPSWLKSLT